MITGQLIVYRTNHLPRTQESKLSRELYGYTDKSQYGKYTYKRPGILDKIPHIIPLGWRALLITRPQNARAVIKTLQEFQAQIYVRRIELEEEDLEMLAQQDKDKGKDKEDEEA